MYIVSADLSMRRPGFALLFFDQETVKVSVVRKSNVNNKSTKKPHGHMLLQISNEMNTYLNNIDYTAVRQEAISGIPKGSKTSVTQALAKVVGLSDIMLWSYRKEEWQQVFPTTVKRLVTGDHNAGKDEVAKCVQEYVGPQEFACDDESDAVAVGVAWLIQKGYLKEHERKDKQQLPVHS